MGENYHNVVSIEQWAELWKIHRSQSPIRVSQKFSLSPLKNLKSLNFEFLINHVLSSAAQGRWIEERFPEDKIVPLEKKSHSYVTPFSLPSLPEIEASIISLTLSAGQNRNPETAAAAAHMQ